MSRKTLIQIRRGLEKNISTLAIGELGYCEDSKKLYIGSKAGNVLLVAQTVGDMLKTIYDTNNNGKVDIAEIADKVSWNGITDKPSTFPPSGHTHTKEQISNFPTSLPASGGNADTVDGKHASEFAPSSNSHHLMNSKPASDLPSTWEKGIYYTSIYNNGYPCAYGILLTIKGAKSLEVVQIAYEWTGIDSTIGSAWIRNKRDCGEDIWSSWREFSFTDHNHDNKYMKKGSATWNNLKGV